MARQKLGEILVQRKQISEQELSQAIQEQQRSELRLGELMLENGTVNKVDLIAAMEKVLHAPYVDCAAACPDHEALGRVSGTLARKHCALPLRVSGKVLEVAMVEPQDVAALDELAFAAGLRIQAFFGFRAEVVQGIVRAYGVKEEDNTSESKRQEECPVGKVEFIFAECEDSDRPILQFRIMR